MSCLTLLWASCWLNTVYSSHTDQGNISLCTAAVCIIWAAHIPFLSVSLWCNWFIHELIQKWITLLTDKTATWYSCMWLVGSSLCNEWVLIEFGGVWLVYSCSLQCWKWWLLIVVLSGCNWIRSVCDERSRDCTAEFNVLRSNVSTWLQTSLSRISLRHKSK